MNYQENQANRNVQPATGQYCLSPNLSDELFLDSTKKQNSVIECKNKSDIHIFEKQVITSIELDKELKKEIMREQSSERKKSQFDALEIKDGVIVEETTNLIEKVHPRKVTNIRSPSLKIFMCADNTEEEIWILEFEINSKTSRIYINPNKMTDNYLIHKFSAKGCQVFKQNTKDIARTIRNLLAVLRESADYYIVPNKEGWYEYEDKLYYCKEGRLTWQSILKKRGKVVCLLHCRLNCIFGSL